MYSPLPFDPVAYRPHGRGEPVAGMGLLGASPMFPAGAMWPMPIEGLLASSALVLGVAAAGGLLHGLIAPLLNARMFPAMGSVPPMLQMAAPPALPSAPPPAQAGGMQPLPTGVASFAPQAYRPPPQQIDPRALVGFMNGLVEQEVSDVLLMQSGPRSPSYPFLDQLRRPGDSVIGEIELPDGGKATATAYRVGEREPDGSWLMQVDLACPGEAIESRLVRMHDVRADPRHPERLTEDLNRARAVFDGHLAQGNASTLAVVCADGAGDSGAAISLLREQSLIEAYEDEGETRAGGAPPPPGFFARQRSQFLEDARAEHGPAFAQDRDRLISQGAARLHDQALARQTPAPLLDEALTPEAEAALPAPLAALPAASAGQVVAPRLRLPPVPTHDPAAEDRLAEQREERRILQAMSRLPKPPSALPRSRSEGDLRRAGETEAALTRRLAQARRAHSESDLRAPSGQGGPLTKAMSTWFQELDRSTGMASAIKHRLVGDPASARLGDRVVATMRPLIEGMRDAHRGRVGGAPDDEATYISENLAKAARRAFEALPAQARDRLVTVFQDGGAPLKAMRHARDALLREMTSRSADSLAPAFALTQRRHEALAYTIAALEFAVPSTRESEA